MYIYKYIYMLVTSFALLVKVTRCRLHKLTVNWKNEFTKRLTWLRKEWEVNTTPAYCRSTRVPTFLMKVFDQLRSSYLLNITITESRMTVSIQIYIAWLKNKTQGAALRVTNPVKSRIFQLSFSKKCWKELLHNLTDLVFGIWTLKKQKADILLVLFHNKSRCSQM